MSGQIGQVELSDVLALPEAWPREGLDRARVEEFVGLYEADGPQALPPLEVVHGGERRGFVLADGWHRHAALGELGVGAVSALILPLGPGDEPVAIAYERALECSARTSKPLTSAEKRAAIARLIEERPRESDRAIGRLVGVDHKTVGRVRERRISPPRPTRQAPSPANMAERLLRAFEQAYDTRGLGVADFFLGDRTGERFAEVFRAVYGDAALDWAQAMGGWLNAAVNALETESPNKPDGDE